MTDEISGLKGFSTETLGLRAREQAAGDSAEKTEAPPREPPTTQNTPASTLNGRLSDSAARNASSPVKTKFVEDANKAATSLNVREETLDQAEAVLDRELNATEELKKAVETGNGDAVKSAQTKLGSVRKDRDALSGRIEKETEASKARGEEAQSVKLGREEKARVELPPLQFPASPKGVDLSTVAGINTALQAIKNDKAEVGAQKQAARSSKESLRASIEKGSQELGGIEKDSVRTPEEAEGLAARTASAIGSNRSQALSAFSSLNEERARELLQP